jgi:hypothetical protein
MFSTISTSLNIKKFFLNVKVHYNHFPLDMGVVNESVNSAYLPFGFPFMSHFQYHSQNKLFSMVTLGPLSWHIFITGSGFNL